MLSFDQLRKKVKREFLEEKIDFELRTTSKSDSQDVDFKHVRERLLATILGQVRDKSTQNRSNVIWRKNENELSQKSQIKRARNLRKKRQVFYYLLLLLVL